MLHYSNPMHDENFNLDFNLSASNFNFLLVFVGKIKLNSYYKKMIEKMYDNLQQKYRNSVFQILKICKAFSNLDFDSKLGKKYTGLCNCLKLRS